MSVATATITPVATVDELGVTLLIDDEDDMHFMSLVSLLGNSTRGRGK